MWTIRSTHRRHGADRRRRRLSDRGLVTIEPDRVTFRVSEGIRDEYGNGRVSFELEGKRRIVRPELPEERPNVRITRAL